MKRFELQKPICQFFDAIKSRYFACEVFLGFFRTIDKSSQLQKNRDKCSEIFKFIPESLLVNEFT